MDYETKIYLDKLIEAVEKLGKPDWWVFGATVVGIIISGWLSYLLIKLTKRLGEHQNNLQHNNLRIQMHKEYFEIYDALVQDCKQIDNWGHQLMNEVKERSGHSLSPSKVQEIKAKAKQLLTPNDYNDLSDFADCYTEIQQTTQYLYNDIRNNKGMRTTLKSKLKNEDAETIIENMSNIKTNDNIKKCKENIEKIKTLLGNNLKEKILSYSDLSDIIKRK